MSNSGLTTEFARCFIYFMAVVILLQGGVYLGLSIWGLTLRQCSENTSNETTKPFKFLMHLIYFLGKECGNPSVKLPNVSEPLTMDLDFSKVNLIANRTFIFCITYAVISVLWVVTSLIVIGSLCGPITKTVNRLCFWPWFLVIMAGSLLDVVATIYHVHDIINTASVAKLFNYLGITAKETTIDLLLNYAVEKTIELLSNYDFQFVTPAIIMTSISSRVVLIWLLNIIGSSFCLSLSNALSRRNSSKQSSVTSLATTSTAPVNNLPQQSSTELSTAEAEQLQESSNAQRFQSSCPHKNKIESSTIAAPNLYHTVLPSNESQKDSHVDRTNNPPHCNLSLHQLELSPISPLNNRYSTNNENLQFPIQNQRVSEELRGQLPWSYTSMASPTATKYQTHFHPEIPAPDYGH